MRVSVAVYSDDPATLAKAVEVLSRAASGLLLEGVETFISMGPELNDEDAE